MMTCSIVVRPLSLTRALIASLLIIAAIAIPTLYSVWKSGTTTTIAATTAVTQPAIMEGDLEKLRRENIKLKQEIETLKRTLEELRSVPQQQVTEAPPQNPLQTSTSETEELRMEIDKLREQLNQLNSSYQELKSKYDSLLNEYNKLRGEYEKLKRKYSDLMIRYENLSKSLSVLKSYRSSAVVVRQYEREARKFLETRTYKEEFYDWRFWVITENYNSQMRGERANKSIARIFALMVQRDLEYNYDLYKRMIDDWLKVHPASDEVSLANEIARLFYSLDHQYAVPGKDEPNAELPLFPIELLAYGLGDCEDHAMLMAALYKVAGFRVAIVVVKDHTDVAIMVNGRWVYLEASIHQPNQKDLPSGFYSTVTIWDLEGEFRKRWGRYQAYWVEVQSGPISVSYG